MGEGRWAAASRRRRNAGVESFALIAPMPLLFAIIALPPWFSGVRVLCGFLGLALLLGATLWSTSRQRRREQEGRPSPPVTGWPRALAVCGLLAGMIGIVIAGSPTLAAATLPADAPTVLPQSTTSTCAGRVCRHEVTFTLNGHTYTAIHPVSLFTDVDDSTPFVVDPQDTRRAMPEHDFRYGRGAGRAWSALSLAAFYGLPAAGAVMMLRRERATTPC